MLQDLLRFESFQILCKSSSSYHTGSLISWWYVVLAHTESEDNSDWKRLIRVSSSQPPDSCIFCWSPWYLDWVPQPLHQSPQIYSKRSFLLHRRLQDWWSLVRGHSWYAPQTSERVHLHRSHSLERSSDTLQSFLRSLHSRGTQISGQSFFYLSRIGSYLHHQRSTDQVWIFHLMRCSSFLSAMFQATSLWHSTRFPWWICLSSWSSSDLFCFSFLSSKGFRNHSRAFDLTQYLRSRSLQYRSDSLLHYLLSESIA